MFRLINQQDKTDVLFNAVGFSFITTLVLYAIMLLFLSSFPLALCYTGLVVSVIAIISFVFEKYLRLIISNKALIYSFVGSSITAAFVVCIVATIVFSNWFYIGVVIWGIILLVLTNIEYNSWWLFD